MEGSYTSISEFIQSRKEIKSAAISEELAFQTSVESAKARCRVDFNFYAGLLLGPDIMETAFPPFYSRDLFGLLTGTTEDPYHLLRFALGLPRGFVKTTFCKIVVCWLIHHGYNDFILVVCATDGLAQNFLNDVDEMLSAPSVEQLYGTWSSSKDTDNSKMKIGWLEGRRIVLVPKGAQASVRGINIHHKRPNLIVCDDIQTRECALSEIQNDALIDWFTGTLLKCLSKRGSNRRVIFLGNMYPGECLLKVLRDNPSWVSMITGAILSDGESLWPELQPVHSLIAEYKHDEKMGKGHIWFAEVQNDPLDARYRLLAEPIPTTFDELVATNAADAYFITVDPAGFRKSSDDNVVALHGVYDGIPVCEDMKGGVWNPKETVINILEMALEHGVSIIGIESTGYQQSLQFWVNQFLIAKGLRHIHVVELKTNNKTKLSRIRNFITELMSGDAGMAAGPRALFSYYASMYKLDKTDNRDDYLDAPAYQRQIMTDYGALLAPPTQVASDLSSLPPMESVDIGV